MTDRPSSGALLPRRVLRVGSLSRVIVFLIVTFTLTWVAFLPLISGSIRPESVVGQWLIMVGIGAPTITAFSSPRSVPAAERVRRLLREGVRWRLDIARYAVVLLLPAIAFGASWEARSGDGGDTWSTPGVGRPRPERAGVPAHGLG